MEIEGCPHCAKAKGKGTEARELTREQVEELVAQTVGPQCDDSERACVMILAHDRALRDKLAQVEQRLAEGKEKWQIRRQNLIEHYEAQLTAQAATIKGLMDDKAAACGELMVSMEDAPIGSLVAKLVIANRVLRSERANLQATIKGLEEELKQEKYAAVSGPPNVDAPITWEEECNRLKQALAEAHIAISALQEQDSSNVQIIAAQTKEITDLCAENQRLSDSLAQVTEERGAAKLWNGMVTNAALKAACEERDQLTLRLATLEAALRKIYVYAYSPEDRLAAIQDVLREVIPQALKALPDAGPAEKLTNPEENKKAVFNEWDEALRRMADTEPGAAEGGA